MTAIEVYLDVSGTPERVGTVDVERLRGVTTSTFAYERSYLAGTARPLSPHLSITSAVSVTEGLPGALDDSAPDLWGRNLLTRRVAREAARAGPGLPTLTETDFLLGVSDRTRQGALRLSLGGPFLAEGEEIPRLVDLDRLLRAATKVALGGAEDEAVAELLAAGSGSLGGARPKASVSDGERLWIAKFPHPDDRWDVIRWESATLELARRCGIRTPEHRLVMIGSHPVLLVERFDHLGDLRIPYLSARSVLGGTRVVGDYLEIAESITDHGSQVADDLLESWRRIAFSVAVNNTDDHLKNHGFLWRRGGWTLSPVFDVNPDPDLGARRMTSLAGETSPAGCRTALRSQAPRFGLSTDEADETWSEMVEHLAGWRDVARAHGVDDLEMATFAPSLDRWSNA